MVGMRKTLVDYKSIIRRFDKTDDQPENICRLLTLVGGQLTVLNSPYVVKHSKKCASSHVRDRLGAIWALACLNNVCGELL